MTRSEAQLRELLAEIQKLADVREATRAALADPSRNRELGGRVHLLAIGKASLEMASEACVALGARVVRGLVTAVPERMGHVVLSENVRVMPADHPLPTERNLAAAREVAAFVRSVPAEHKLLVLISGGGSAHLALPAEGITLADLRRITSTLQKAGATIDELNAVRKHCEQLKGGRLAQMCGAAGVVVLIVSDVIGDHRDVISSGPFAPDRSTFNDATDVLAARGAAGVANSIDANLKRGALGQIPETPKPGDAAFSRVSDAIIAGNARLVAGVRSRLARVCDAIVVRSGVVGEASELGEELVGVLKTLAREHPGGRVGVVFGGEWTVSVGGATGLGGPSQEMALAAANELRKLPEASVLCYSTDGIDGPTDAAGALVTGSTCQRAEAAGHDVAEALCAHDSHRVLEEAGALVRTGPTGTNVNHVAVALV